MKKLLCVIIACLLLALPVSAAETEETTSVPEETQRQPGQCGEAAWWQLEGGELTISGTGAMDDFDGDAPWRESREEIVSLIIADGITYIGAHAFADFDALIQVSLGNTVTELGTGAFQSCDSLTELTLPAAFRIIGEDALRSCAMLQTIHFGGGMPSFRLNCLWDTYADLVFPAKNPWPLEHIEQLEEAFQGRIEFLASDGTDPYISEADLEEATAPTEQPQATQAPPTEPAETVPAALPTAGPQATTAPETTVPETQSTEAPTTAPTETTPVTVSTEPEPPRRSEGGGIGLAIVLGTLSLLMLGALIFGRKRPRGRYSK